MSAPKTKAVVISYCKIKEHIKYNNDVFFVCPYSITFYL